ncbi:sensor histidine kinase [Neobacillus sedimentimangrovi]|uniref:histidine kinase n=1 Tax=Neobacillus sedimentimangrovi TaxID=2699460 RepID=A0ABS8QE17_9BACI|nr:sensor histidine kinase [Neobacillus sedimentimangrovi]AIM16916.1 histidine kinase [Bacillus sp. X1(2014)]MCD4837504.1 sensor histidine kinase [Neobacillus sedimentimangrovi]
MIKKYLIERRSWILLVLFLEALTLVISYLDSAIPVLPILYIVFLSLLIFFIFLFYRYQKETKFFKSLQEWDNDLDVTRLADAESPFEKIIETSVINQTELLKRESSYNLMTLEQEKDDLLAWIHEVKTPLTAMSLMIDRIEDEKLKASLTYEWLRIHLLLDQQLHQKRIPFMENDLYIEKTDLKAVIFKEIKALKSWCMQKGIGFEVNLEGAEVLTDAKWLAFILRQLLTNAVKYSEASDIFIKSYGKDGHTILEIKDYGRGIDPKDLPRIFEKGFTSTTAHQDRASTGMGLYLAQKAAEPLRIHIHVDSILGEGTTFTLTFPKKNEFDHITGM